MSYIINFSKVGKELQDGYYWVYLRYYHTLPSKERKSNFYPIDEHLLAEEIQINPDASFFITVIYSLNTSSQS